MTRRKTRKRFGIFFLFEKFDFFLFFGLFELVGRSIQCWCFLGFSQKREKRRWIFRKPTTQETASPQTQSKVPASAGTAGGGVAPVNDDVSAAAAAEQRHAIAVAAAEATVATAQAAVDVARLARPSSNHYARENYAAIVIQTAFRGYLVRSKK